LKGVILDRLTGGALRCKSGEQARPGGRALRGLVVSNVNVNVNADVNVDGIPEIDNVHVHVHVRVPPIDRS
jgi:hypothetical protein